MNPYISFGPLEPDLIRATLLLYRWTFVCEVAVILVVAWESLKRRRSRFLKRPTANLWVLPAYLWSAQSILKAHEVWAHIGESHYPVERIQPAELMFSMFGALAILMTVQTLAVLAFDRARLPDGLSGRMGAGARVAILTVFLDSFFLLKIWWGDSYWLAG